jgi:hypothetical protein
MISATPVVASPRRHGDRSEPSSSSSAPTIRAQCRQNLNEKTWRQKPVSRKRTASGGNRRSEPLLRSTAKAPDGVPDEVNGYCARVSFEASRRRFTVNSEVRAKPCWRIGYSRPSTVMLTREPVQCDPAAVGEVVGSLALPGTFHLSTRGAPPPPSVLECRSVHRRLEQSRF